MPGGNCRHANMLPSEQYLGDLNRTLPSIVQRLATLSRQVAAGDAEMAAYTIKTMCDDLGPFAVPPDDRGAG